MAEFQAIIDDDAKLTEITKQIFDQVDADGSGQISASEMESAMNMVAEQAGIPKPSQEDCAAAMKELDTDQSGQLSFEEFKSLVVAILPALASDPRQPELFTLKGCLLVKSDNQELIGIVTHHDL